MFTHIFRSILFCGLVALAGCVTFDANPAYDFSGSAENGLLVVSARHTNVRWVDLFYRNIKTRANGFLRTYSTYGAWENRGAGQPIENATMGKTSCRGRNATEFEIQLLIFPKFTTVIASVAKQSPI